MKPGGFLSQKATGKHILLLLLILAVPAFFWFRFLYHEYVVKPDQISPEMQRMRDAMMKAHGQPSAPSTAKSSGEKGGKKTPR
jgi:hypothetical protein